MTDNNALLDDIDAMKKRLNALRPLENPSILHALDIEYTFENNRIEGNTLTLRETGFRCLYTAFGGIAQLMTTLIDKGNI